MLSFFNILLSLLAMLVTQYLHFYKDCLFLCYLWSANGILGEILNCQNVNQYINWPKGTVDFLITNNFSYFSNKLEYFITLDWKYSRLLGQGILKGELSLYHWHLLFDLFGLVCFTNKNKNCQLSYSWFHTSQTGGQWYSDISPLVFPDWVHS